jgi:hypothetical protein
MLIDNIEIELLNSIIDFNNLKKLFKIENNEYGCIFPKKKLGKNKYIVYFIDKKTKIITSFIWFNIYNNNILLNINKYIQIIFSYTFKKYRNIGLNNKLRLWIEEFSLKNNINNIISIPLPGSNSKRILEKSGYSKINEYYLKKIKIIQVD